MQYIFYIKHDKKITNSLKIAEKEPNNDNNDDGDNRMIVMVIVTTMK